MVGDIDILIDNQQIRQSKNIFKKMGYLGVDQKKFFEKRHIARRIDRKKIFAVEIHTKLFDNEKILDSKDILKNKKIINSIHVMDNLTRLKFSVYNFQINDYGFHKSTYSFKSIYDTYLLSKKIKNTNIINEK